jgi:hypothetical protein
MARHTSAISTLLSVVAAPMGRITGRRSARRCVGRFGKGISPGKLDIPG